MTNSPILVGRGPTRVIALSGWFVDAAGWGNFHDLINAEQQSWAFVNYRGYGDRKDLDGPFTNAQIAADVLEVADRLEWDDFALVGHSAGGKAIQRIYADAPQRVTALIGISPIHASAFPFDDEGWKLFEGAVDSEKNRYTIIDYTTGNRNSATWINKIVAYSLSCSTPEAFGGYLTAWGKEDFLADLPDDDHPPVHAIVGRNDPAVGEEYVRSSWMKTYSDSTIDVIADGGHYSMWEAPVALLTSIEKALAR
ncbi:MAG TPA: alpha/beta hydrolase [Propionibacteriaceae bacterium]|nr:alpha/beta hydrolase [Propionibacteriaceae bacterium]